MGLRFMPELFKGLYPGTQTNYFMDISMEIFFCHFAGVILLSHGGMPVKIGFLNTRGRPLNDTSSFFFSLSYDRSI
jgi:hypothetical protein